MVGGLRKVGPEIKVTFTSPKEKKKREYKNKFPKGMKTLAQVKEKGPEIKSLLSKGEE